MYHLIRIGVVSLYVSLTGISFLFSLALGGVYFSWAAFFAMMAGWLLFCGLSIYLFSPFHRFFYGELRKPIMEEAKRLEGCLAEVMGSAGGTRKIEICIIETEAVDAFASYLNTIAVSVGLMAKLTDEELKGVIAHELGHLISRDTTAGWAVLTASRLPALVRKVFSPLRQVVRGSIGMILLVLTLLFLFKPAALLPVVALLLFIATSWLLDRIFRWLRLLLTRIGEYRQDAFAYRLGYGRGLCQALVKFASFGSQPVNAFFIVMHGTHPVIYNRIHRLERLLNQ
jgi:heat shock protein HtpX